MIFILALALVSVCTVVMILTAASCNDAEEQCREYEIRWGLTPYRPLDYPHTYRQTVVYSRDPGGNSHQRRVRRRAAARQRAV